MMRFSDRAIVEENSSALGHAARVDNWVNIIDSAVEYVDGYDKVKGFPLHTRV